MPKLRKRRITALATALAAVAAAAGCTPAQAAIRVTPAQYQAGFAKAISADVAASTRLPGGYDLWVTGDVTSVNGASVVGWGYPHGAFLLEAPGSASFRVLAGKYGYGYQQVPNWPGGDFFWMQVPLVDRGNGTLNVIGERVHATGTCGLCFTIAGTYDAVFSDVTLAYRGTRRVPPTASGDVWTGGTSDGSGGWWLTSQHGELAHVSAGHLATTSWQVYPHAVPASLGSWLVRAGTHWNLFGEQYLGIVIQQWTAPRPTGPWSGPMPAGTTTPDTDGGIAAHPELGAPAGYVLISWLVNVPGTAVKAAQYGPQFRYVKER